MDLNASNAAIPAEPAPRREALRITPCLRPNRHNANAVHCLRCNRTDVALAHVQVATDGGTAGLITHTINVASGEALGDDGPPVAGREAATSRATRIALTFQCAECGYDWATIFPQDNGITYVYKAAPTIKRS